MPLGVPALRPLASVHSIRRSTPSRRALRFSRTVNVLGKPVTFSRYNPRTDEVSREDAPISRTRHPPAARTKAATRETGPARHRARSTRGRRGRAVCRQGKVLHRDTHQGGCGRGALATEGSAPGRSYEGGTAHTRVLAAQGVAQGRPTRGRPWFAAKWGYPMITRRSAWSGSGRPRRPGSSWPRRSPSSGTAPWMRTA